MEKQKSQKEFIICKMKEISQKQAKEQNLKLVKTISADDMSKVILTIERMKEDNQIKFYTINSIIFNQMNHKGNFNVSFWE